MYSTVPVSERLIWSRRWHSDSAPRRAGSNFFGWLQLPAGVGIGCLAVLQLWRIRKRKKRDEAGDTSQLESPKSWQMSGFELLPTRMLSYYWGQLHRKELPRWLCSPVLGLYVKVFGCDMLEAENEQLCDYKNLCELFTRKLKSGAREVDPNCELVVPCDGKVLFCGEVVDGQMEQVKGVNYSLESFVGPNLLTQSSSMDSGPTLQGRTSPWYQSKKLYHVIIYLGPGDCHHFHSPVSWTVDQRRHFHGHLITVAPWAARRMKRFLSENERVLYSGQWHHGFFSFTAVGAYNVGSIEISIENDLKTNLRSAGSLQGQYASKQLTEKLVLNKGDHIGVFNLGSSIVLIFEAPGGFKFGVQPGDRVTFGQSLGVR